MKLVINMLGCTFLPQWTSTIFDCTQRRAWVKNRVFTRDVAAGVPKKRSGGRVGALNYSSGNWPLFLHKRYLLLWLKNMLIDSVSENSIQEQKKLVLVEAVHFYSLTKTSRRTSPPIKGLQSTWNACLIPPLSAMFSPRVCEPFNCKANKNSQVGQRRQKSVVGEVVHSSATTTRSNHEKETHTTTITFCHS